MSLYLIVLIFVIAGPFALSFEKNLKLYKRWIFLIPAILTTMAIFVTWDVIFTHLDYWVFNPRYNSGIYFFKLPLEEYLFFIAIPYACAFSYYAIQFHFPKYKLSNSATKYISLLLIAAAIIIAIIYRNNIYTFINFIMLALIIALSYWIAKSVLNYYYVIFPILLIPFFVVNGILTGTGIEQAVFDYHPEVITGLHLLSIPIEDAFYAFSLILLTLSLTHFFESNNKKAKHL